MQVLPLTGNDSPFDCREGLCHPMKLGHILDIKFGNFPFLWYINFRPTTTTSGGRNDIVPKILDKIGNSGQSCVMH